MRIVWDQNKNRSNRAKHKVSFEVASLVFEDPLHLSRIDRIVDGEVRWQTIGMVGGVLLLLVAHTWEEYRRGNGRPHYFGTKGGYTRKETV